MAAVVQTDHRILLQLDYEEALTLLATLNANPSYANRSIRMALGEYIDKLPTK